MAFTGISNAYALSNLIQPYFTQGVFVQPNRSIAEFEYLSRIPGDAKAAASREIKFNLLEGLDYRSAGMKNPGTTNFLKGYREATAEYTATLKEFQATIELEASLIRRAMAAKELKYDDPLAIAMTNKVIVLKRILGMYMHGDGSGRLAEVASAAGNLASTGRLTVTLEKTGSEIGFVRHLMKNDLVSVAAPDGTPRVPSGGTLSGTFFAWRVIDRSASTIASPTATLQAVDVNGTAVTVTAGTEASNIADGDFFYRTAQGITDSALGASVAASTMVFPDVSGSISDYGTLSSVFPGFESLISGDARVVHGVTMSGSIASQVESTGGVLDAEIQFENLLNTLKIEQGDGTWKYEEALISPAVRSALIKSGEVDRRFQARDDIHRGSRKFSYTHGNDEVNLRISEFSRDDRIWIVPSSGNGGSKVLQWHFLPFEPVKGQNGDDWHLLQSSGLLTDVMAHVTRGFGTLLNLQPSSTGVATSFTL